MNLYAGLTREALELVRQHQRTIDHLPRTFLINALIELEKWPTFFAPEKAYFRSLLDVLSSLPQAQFEQIFGSLARFESSTGCTRVTGKDADELRERILAWLQRHGEYTPWRTEIDLIFGRLEPLVETRLYSGALPTRVVVVIYGEGISIRRGELWKRFQSIGRRVPLDLSGAGSSASFLQSLFTGQAAGSSVGAPTLFEVLGESPGCSPLDTWIIEAGDALHQLCESRVAARPPSQRWNKPSHPAHWATGLSYDRLHGYRERLTDAIHAKVLEGLHSPVELAAYVRTLEVAPEPTPGGPPHGLTLYADRVVLAFLRETFLAGNGTLIINNTFVEWGTIQALKRAQPRLLVARFGVRDKMKPFSSLVLFSKPRPTDQIPIMQDPLGSFIDAELLAYYIWLNAEKGLPYRGKTLYLMLAEDVDEMLVVPPKRLQSSRPLLPATLPDVAVTMANWLGLELAHSSGRPLMFENRAPEAAWGQS